MGRPYEGKTETINQRSIRVYLPTLEDVQRWKQRAQRAQRKLAPFLLECASRGLQDQPPSRDRERLEDALRHVERLQAELVTMQERHRWDEKLLRLQERELQQLRSRSARPRSRARRRIQPKLLRLLREKPSVEDRDLYRALGISRTSPEAARMVQDLEILERGGLVERTGNGWRLLVRDPGP